MKSLEQGMTKTRDSDVPHTACPPCTLSISRKRSFVLIQLHNTPVCRCQTMGTVQQGSVFPRGQLTVAWFEECRKALPTNQTCKDSLYSCPWPSLRPQPWLGMGRVTSSHCLSPVDLLSSSWGWRGDGGGKGTPSRNSGWRRQVCHITVWEGGALGHCSVHHQTLNEWPNHKP